MEIPSFIIQPLKCIIIILYYDSEYTKQIINPINEYSLSDEESADDIEEEVIFYRIFAVYLTI